MRMTWEEFFDRNAEIETQLYHQARRAGFPPPRARALAQRITCQPLTRKQAARLLGRVLTKRDIAKFRSETQ